MRGVPLALPEVLGGLQTGRIDTFPSSALAAVGLQWYTQARYVSEQGSGIVVGAMVIRKPVFDALDADMQSALVETARASERRLQRGVRDFDRRAYETLVRRGMRPVDAEAHRAEWEAVGERARRRLTGRLFPSDLLSRVERIAERNR